MFYSLKRIINTKLFNYLSRGILKLPGVNCDYKSNVVIVSQLCSRDLIMYLVAIKTFTNYVTPLNVVIVGDRLSEKDIELLRKHINNIEIIDIVDVNTNEFPNGGTWERLLTIIEKSQDHYVIQLDADTITLSMPEEVVQCIAENRSFTLGTEMGQEIITFQDATKLLKDQGNKSQHVQVLAELALDEIDQTNNLKYIRGCSAFTGYAKNTTTIEQAKIISRAIEHKIGKDKWLEWGSEQVASNIAIANSNNPLVLPIKKYHYYKPGVDFNQFHLLHFVGSYRFNGGEYARLASVQIEILKSIF